MHIGIIMLFFMCWLVLFQDLKPVLIFSVLPLIYIKMRRSENETRKVPSSGLKSLPVLLSSCKITILSMISTSPNSLTFLDGPSLMMIGFILVSNTSMRFLCSASRASRRAAQTSSRGPVLTCSSFSFSSHSPASWKK